MIADLPVVLAEYNVEWITQAFNHVYDGYVVPVHMDAASLRRHIRTAQIDLSISPALVDERGEIGALALLGVRGKRAWIGGFGVAPEQRRRGVAAELIKHALHAASSAGVHEVALEVFTHNVAAVRVYRRAGFAVKRDLCIFEGVATGVQAEDPGVADAALDDAIEASLRRTVAPCWQRETEALRAMPDLQAIAIEGSPQAGYALYAKRDGGVRIADLWAPPGYVRNASRLLAALNRRFDPGTPLMLLNEPPESPVTSALLEAGWKMRYIQHEMRRVLA